MEGKEGAERNKRNGKQKAQRQARVRPGGQKKPFGRLKAEGGVSPKREKGREKFMGAGATIKRRGRAAANSKKKKGGENEKERRYRLQTRPQRSVRLRFMVSSEAKRCPFHGVLTS